MRETSNQNKKIMKKQKGEAHIMKEKGKEVKRERHTHPANDNIVKGTKRREREGREEKE